MQFKDYYKILGISRDADEKAIKQAYRRLARKFHPDVSKEANAEEKFKELQEAYEVLKDPEKRRSYDQFGEHWKAGMEHGGAQAAGGPGGFYRESIRPEDAADFSDLFGSIFGDFASSRRQQASWRGQDEYAHISISLEEAYKGVMKTLSLDGWELDKQGQPVRKQRTLKVKIPAGVTDNQRIRLAGQGQKGSAKGGNGDLYLTVSIKAHPSYRTNKRDLYLEVPVAPWEAALGGKITVSTLGGKIKLTIPPGSQSGNELRLRGLGLPGYPPGDLYAVLKVVLPEPRSETDRDLYRKMQQSMNFDPRTTIRS